MAFPNCHFDPEECNDNTPRAAVGHYYTWGGNLYMYVYNESTTVSAKGAPAFEQATRGYMKKNTNKTGDAIAEGAWCAAVTTLYYGYILVRGWADYLLGNTGTAAGESLYAGADIWDTATVGTHHVQGRAATDDTASVFTGRINCL